MSGSVTGPSSASNSLSPATLVAAARRRPIPRKGHRKSRAGCVICKKRKVKCDEVTPECGCCRRLGLTCQYQLTGGNTSSSALAPSSASVLGAVSRPLRAEPASFTIQDLNFFQHFLSSAYPSLPIGGWDVWQEVGKMSHHYSFLVHSMLGLGASHLSTISPSSYADAALKHRITAMKELNEHMARPDLNLADAEAAFAAMLSLTFQSAYMPDGMIDFLTMVRGCYLVGDNLIGDKMDISRFASFSRATYVERVKELIGYEDGARSLDMAVAEGFCSSLQRLAPLCRSVPEIEYLAKMKKIATCASTDPAESYHQHSFIFDRLGSLCPDDFRSLVDPNNYVSSLIILHFLTLDFVMTRKEVVDGRNVRLYDGIRRGYDCRKGMALIWIDKIISRLPLEYKQYAEWPAKFCGGISLTFEIESEIWKPFLLHRGQAIIADSLRLDAAPED